MLKRLFISLLILSALTSDGIVVLPSNIYHMINSGSQFGLSGEKVMPSGQTPRVEQNRGAALKLFAGQVFSLTGGSIEKFKYKLVDCDLVLTYHVYLPELTKNPVSISYLAYNRDNIFVKSGTSPPYAAL